MTTPDPTVEERIAKRREEEQALREGLARVNLDGPYEFPKGDLFGSMFATGPRQFACCLTCGSMVFLDPVMEKGETIIYRDVFTHAQYHEDRGETPSE